MYNWIKQFNISKNEDLTFADRGDKLEKKRMGYKYQ